MPYLEAPSSKKIKNIQYQVVKEKNLFQVLNTAVYVTQLSKYI